MKSNWGKASDREGQTGEPPPTRTIGRENTRFGGEGDFKLWKRGTAQTPRKKEGTNVVENADVRPRGAVYHLEEPLGNTGSRNLGKYNRKG